MVPFKWFQQAKVAIPDHNREMPGAVSEFCAIVVIMMFSMSNWMYQTTCLGRHRGTFPGWLNLILPWFGSKCERRSHWFVPTLGLSSLSRGRTRYCPERHFSENSRSRRWCPASQIPDINQNDAFSPLDLDEVQLPPSCDLSPIMVLPHRLSLLPSVCHISLSWFYIRSSMSFAITNTICHLEPFHFPVSAVQGKKEQWHLNSERSWIWNQGFYKGGCTIG